MNILLFISFLFVFVVDNLNTTLLNNVGQDEVSALLKKGGTIISRILSYFTIYNIHVMYYIQYVLYCICFVNV